MYEHIFIRTGFLLILFLANVNAGNKPEADSLERDYGAVVHASLIFRHGDRNPQITFPADPYRNYSWKGGLGSLTDAGKRRLADVGKWFKTRYRHVIAEAYSPEQIKVDSSNIDRAIMSGQCFLYGFYPTTDSNAWLGDEKWQPIPIHTIAPDRDNMIAGLQRCDKYRQHTDERYAPTYKQFKDVIQFIGNNTGLNFENARMGRIFHLLEQLEDTLLIYRELNFILPTWTSTVFPEPLQKMLLKTQRDPTFSVERSRLAAGPLCNSIISDMRRKIRDDDFKQVVHIYSGHDLTIRRCMIGLNVFEGQRLPYGSALIFELRRKKNTNYCVTVSFKNETFEAPYLLKIPGCERQNCSYKQFERLTRNLIPENWEKECEISWHVFPYSPCVILFIFLTIFTLYSKTRANKLTMSKCASNKS